MRRRIVGSVGFGVLALLLTACGGNSSSASSTTTAKPLATTTTAPPPTTTTTSIATVEALVNTLYYNVSQAYQMSSAAGNQTVFNSDYPGTVNASLYQSCESEDGNDNYTESEAPILSTLMPAPTWVSSGPSASQPYWIAQSGPPAGTTYILQVAVTQPAGTSTNLVHVTILNGKAYLYEGPLC